MNTEQIKNKIKVLKSSIQCLENELKRREKEEAREREEAREKEVLALRTELERERKEKKIIKQHNENLSLLLNEKENKFSSENEELERMLDDSQQSQKMLHQTIKFLQKERIEDLRKKL